MDEATASIDMATVSLECFLFLVFLEGGATANLQRKGWTAVLSALQYAHTILSAGAFARPGNCE